jgi:PadR family transcriptional regulator, regulatory protein PadR
VTTPQMLKGVLPIVVLWTLADDDAYGYAILKRLRDAGFNGVGDASVYGTLQRHHDAGFVTSYLAESGGPGPARRYYSLTPAGRQALENARRDWHALRAAVDAVVPVPQEQPA